jgi:hypothetical protein
MKVGDYVYAHEKNSGNNQRWRVRSNGFIQVYDNDDRVLDVEQGSRNSGARVIVYSRNNGGKGTPNQIFQIEYVTPPPTPSPTRPPTPPSTPPPAGRPKKCCDCSSIAHKRANNDEKKFLQFLKAESNCIDPEVSCGDSFLHKCSAALVSAYFNNDAVCNSAAPDLCGDDCRSVIDVFSVMSEGKKLAIADVVMSVFGVVSVIVQISFSNRSGSNSLIGSIAAFAIGCAIICALVQIGIEAAFLHRYSPSGSASWQTGCEMISACNSDQGPSSDISQVYGNFNSTLQTLWVEIAFNVVSLFVFCFACLERDESKVPSFLLELCLEVLQVIASALVYKDVEASTGAVLLQSGGFIGTFSPDSKLCLLPCCAAALCSER